VGYIEREEAVDLFPGNFPAHYIIYIISVFFGRFHKKSLGVYKNMNLTRNMNFTSNELKVIYKKLTGARLTENEQRLASHLVMKLQIEGKVKP